MKELIIDSPLGNLQIVVSKNGIQNLSFSDIPVSAQPANNLLAKTAQQLKEYFSGERTAFDLPLVPEGTEFQQRVWQALREIPFGQTITYGQLSKKLGDPDAVRAVGTANGKNPIAIIIPCHRVIGSDQKLTGYAGGIERKRWLLQHEGALLL